jgi:hypothetical protein
MNTARYTIPEDVLAAHLEGEAVILDLNTKRYYRLNPTGAAIWRGLEAGLAAPAILERLTRDFDVDAGTAQAELDRLLAELSRLRLIET